MMAIHPRNLRYVFALSFLVSTSVLANTFTWQGPYVGAYLGGGFGSNHMSSNTGSVTSTSYFTTAADINAVNTSGTWTGNPTSVIGGVQAGHDWAYKQLVCGVAVDYSVLPLSSSATTTNTYPDNANQYSVYTSMQTNWLFTFRGRLGLQTEWHVPSLFYLTGGMAMSQLRVSNSFSDNSAFAGRAGSDISQNQLGWTAGAGVEVAAFKHISMDLEYLYVSVPSVKTTGTVSNTVGGFGIPVNSLTSPFSTTANFHASIVKVGFNYRFDE